ncbi:LytR C-terminal domain-containing protein [Janibacter sp. G1551]|uniref:LytR C-terminal domain-containing protein n=1 Tax=Janibacter sp. G1551 TaxID=3420440 RepID=UPI003D03523E
MDEQESAGGGRPDDGRFRAVAVEELSAWEAEHFKRRRRRRFITLITLPGLLLGTATVATAYSAGLFTTSDPVACEPDVRPAPARDSFGVRVINSNETVGQGSEVAATLSKRDFRVVEVGNADSSVYVKKSALIYHGPDSIDQALLLQKQVPGSALWNDGRGGEDIELVIGYGFKRLVNEPGKPPPVPSQIKVNVFNTTYREGLAATVADELKDRSFKIGDVGNDPQLSWPQGRAVIRYGAEGTESMKRLKDHVPGATLVKDGRAGKRLDLVIGATWKGLNSLDTVPVAEKFVRPAETVERPCAK